MQRPLLGLLALTALASLLAGGADARAPLNATVRQADGACGGPSGTKCSGDFCCSQYNFCGSTSAFCGDGCQPAYGRCEGGLTTTAAKRPAKDASVQRPVDFGFGTFSIPYFSSAAFSDFFRHIQDPRCAANGFYLYNALAAAAASFAAEGFLQSPDENTNKLELAAFLAHISHETTGAFDDGGSIGRCGSGLCKKREEGSFSNSQYCQASATFACNSAKDYRGRGPLQITWNYNYIPAGRALGFDGLNDPDAIERDVGLAFESAIWFWMRNSKPVGASKLDLTPHEAITSSAANRFALTTDIINGGLECRTTSTDAANKQADRICYFKRAASLLGVSNLVGADADLRC